MLNIRSRKRAFAGYRNNWSACKPCVIACAGAVSQMGAAFSRPPLDSPGLARTTDLVLKHGETLKEVESSFTECKEAIAECKVQIAGVLDMVTELRDKLPDPAPHYTAPPVRSQPHGPKHLTSRAGPVMQQPSYATVMWSDGSNMAVLEEQLLSFVIPNAASSGS